MSIASLHSSPSTETVHNFEDSSRNEATSQSFWIQDDNKNKKNSSLLGSINHTRSNSENMKKIIPHLNLKKILQSNNRSTAVLVKHKDLSSDYDTENSFLLNKETNYQSKQLNKTCSNLNVSSDNFESLQQKIFSLGNHHAGHLEKQKYIDSESVTSSLSFLPSEGKLANSSSLKRIKELEDQNFNLIQNNNYLSEKLNQLESEYEQMKSYLDLNLEKCGELFLKVQNEDEDKENMARHAKRLDESLKSINKNYILLQKKVAVLEKENRELVANLRICEAEKKSISEKWQKLSKKVRLEGNYATMVKSFENEIVKYQKEVQEYKEKYLFKDSQLKALKEEEKNYKTLLENSIKIMQNLQTQQDNDLKEKNHLIDKNQELIQKLEQLQTGNCNERSLAEELRKNEDKCPLNEANINDLKELETLEKFSPNALQTSFLKKENEELKQSQQILQEKLNSANKKWQLVVDEYNKTQNDYNTLLKERQNEQKENNVQPLLSLIGNQTTTIDDYKDPILKQLHNEIAKVIPLNEELYHKITHYLGMHLENINESSEKNKLQSFSNKDSQILGVSQILERGSREKQIDNKGFIENPQKYKIITEASGNGNGNLSKSKLNSQLAQNDDRNETKIETKPLEKSSDSFSLKGTQFKNSFKSSFQPLQKALSKRINNKKSNFLNERRCSGDSLKENVTPNNLSRENEPKDKETIRVTKDSQVNLSGSYSDLKSQFINSRILRSLSIENPVKKEKKSKSILNATIDLSNSGTFEQNSLLNLSMNNNAPKINTTKRRSIGENNRYPQNKSYIELYLSKKTHKPDTSSIVNSSLNFLSNI